MFLHIVHKEYCPKGTKVLLILFLLNFQGLWCLKDVRLNMPHEVQMGGNITVNCTYTLDNETEFMLYVKYYFGFNEFYKHDPMDYPPISFNALRGVDVHIINEDYTMTLQGVNEKLTGVFKCEVLTNAVLFPEKTFAYVVVVEEPEAEPVITVQHDGFKVGDVVKANCTTRGGFPLANLTWYVDGEEVPFAGVSYPTEYVVEGDVDSLVSVLKLPVEVAPADGHIHLQCKASQFTFYSALTESILNETIPSSSSQLMSSMGGARGRRCVIISVVLAAATMIFIHHSIITFLSMNVM